MPPFQLPDYSNAIRQYRGYPRGVAGLGRHQPQYEPEQPPEQPPQGFLGRLAARMPDYGFNGLPQESYRDALRASMFQAGASMIGRTEDPFTVLGEGIRTGMASHRQNVAGEAQGLVREQQAGAAAQEAQKQQAAVANIEDASEKARLTALIGQDNFWTTYASSTKAEKPEYRSGADDIIEVRDGKATTIYDAPEAPGKPIKARPGDVFLDPKTHQPIYTVPGKTESHSYRNVSPGQKVIDEDGNVVFDYPKPDEPDAEFKNGIEGWIRATSKADYEVAEDTWDRLRAGAGLGGADPEAKAAWLDSNPSPQLKTFQQQAAEKAREQWGYESAHLPEEAAPEPVPVPPTGPAAPGGPADRIRQGQPPGPTLGVAEDLEAEAGSWVGAYTPQWARTQYEKLIAQGASETEAAAAVRSAYSRLTGVR